MADSTSGRIWLLSGIGTTTLLALMVAVLGVAGVIWIIRLNSSRRKERQKRLIWSNQARAARRASRRPSESRDAGQPAEVTAWDPAKELLEGAEESPPRSSEIGSKLEATPGPAGGAQWRDVWRPE